MAQVVFDPGADPSGKSVVPQAVVTAGNGVYRVYVADQSSGTCGAWTARTGPLHEAGPNLNVLYGNGSPSTSDTTLRSWTSGQLYRTGNTGACSRFCSVATPTLMVLSHDGVNTGYRQTWHFTDSPGQTLEFVQEVNVEGPVDGTETAGNTVVRETHVVRNLGSAPLQYGLRKHWDWQIGPDDGPWFGSCETVDRACDRSLNMYASGAGNGRFPDNYVINEDPDIAECPNGLAPRTPAGCAGFPLYLVAGTVAPTGGLDPPPDEPELLQFNAWTDLVSTCWLPSLRDAAFCGDLGSPVDDTATAYFYGLTAATALTLAPGAERSFTQYVVAGDQSCPTVLDPPDASCTAGGDYGASCTALLTDIQLDGTITSADPPAQILWTTDCPSATFSDPGSEDPLLTVVTEGCALTCSVALTLTPVGGGPGATCTALVVVQDDGPPTLTCPPADLHVECQGGGIRRDDPEVLAWRASAHAEDDCTQMSVPVTDDLPLLVARTGCPTERLVTFRADDGCGNISTCTRLLVINDTTPPVVTAPAAAGGECGVVTAADRAAWLATATADDACEGSLSVAADLLGTTSPCLGRVIETWRFQAQDACGNSGLSTATWTIDDHVPPVVTAPADRSVDCGSVAPGDLAAWLASASAMDACTGASPTVTAELAGSSGPCPGTQVATWRFVATDACGNVGEALATYVVQDVTAPVLAGVPADVTVACNAVPQPAQPSATDACDLEPSVLWLGETRTDGPCPDSYSLARRWQAADHCGNLSPVAVQLITVRDLAAPVLAGVPADVSVSCTSVPPVGTPTASDDCDPAPVVSYLGETIKDGGCPDERVLTRAWRAADRCGNTSALALQVISVRDLVAPVLSGVPADVTVSCTSLPPVGLPSASDDCDPAPAVAFLGELREDGDCPQSYRLVRTWQAEDRCGNASAIGVQVVTVRDLGAPALLGVPQDLVLSCGELPPAVEPSATDDCDPSPSVLYLGETVVNGPCLDSHSLVRKWQAVDHCGNASAIGEQVVTFVDLEPPTLALVPGNTTVGCDGVPPPSVPTATDSCDPGPIVTFDEVRVDGACPQSFELQRTWTATDRCGNASSATQVVTVVDDNAPGLVGVPADLSVACDAVPPPAEPTAVDACDPSPLVTFEQSRADGPCPDSYILLRSWTATDHCGNTTAAVQYVTVVDLSPPVLSGVPVDVTVACDAVTAPATGVTAADACDPSPSLAFMEQRLDGDCPDAYTLRRTWSATDRCGNVAQAVQDVTVVDDVAPEPFAWLAPLAPAPPTSAASPSSAAAPASPASAAVPASACSAPSSGLFVVTCGAQDACDPQPSVSARLLVTHHDVPLAGRACVPRIDVVPVACGEVVEIRLVAPPCPARPPQSARQSVAVTSEGLRVVTGEQVVLEVTAIDRCGNLAAATHDPASAPLPPCPAPLPDGSCCPLIAAPPAGPCSAPCGSQRNSLPRLAGARRGPP